MNWWTDQRTSWRGFLAVIYKEIGEDDGFIITAFFTKKPKKRGKVWPK
jgi:hypothetical protein